jgi:hypothetical protein
VGSTVHTLFADADRFARHSPGRRWFVDEIYLNLVRVGKERLVAAGARGGFCRWSRLPVIM